jgi:lactoylglutathione lyase
MAITKKKTKARAKTGPAAKRAISARKAPRARAQPAGVKLGSVAPSFTVNDVEKSLAWYRDVLGLVPKDRWEHDGTLLGVEMQAGSVTFMLGQDDWKKGRDRVKGEGFRLYCDTAQDVDRLAAQIEARGGTLLHAPRDEPWGARAFTVADPDGFMVTISRRLRRGRK